MDLFYWTQIFRFTFKKSLLNREWFISLLAVKLHNKVMCHENKLHDIDSTWHHVLWHKDTWINFHMSLFYWHKTPPWRCTHVRQVFHHVPFYVPPKEHFQCKDSNIKFWSKHKHLKCHSYWVLNFWGKVRPKIWDLIPMWSPCH